MKGLVVYDSVYGNTKLVAEAIAQQIKKEGHDVQLISLKEPLASSLVGDFMFLGSPTRYFSMTSEAKDFVKGMKGMGWKAQPVVMFDTMMGVPEGMAERNEGKWAVKGAAPKLRDIARDQGINVEENVLHIGVIGLKGPLMAKAQEEAAKYVHDSINALLSR